MQSMARSVSSSTSSFEERILEKDFPLQTEMWLPGPPPSKPLPALEVVELDLSRRESTSTSHSHSTLALDPLGHPDSDEMDPKTPKATHMSISESQVSPSTIYSDHPPPGPLESQLLSLLSSISLIERDRPTIMSNDYATLQSQLSTLQAEKATWSARHETLFALRDEDVTNLIKVRGLLADERRAHAEIRKLRDDDIHNVIELRGKLAEATWAIERGNGSANGVSFRPERSPSAAVGSGRAAARQSRGPESADLWQAAKTAAMEQRALELEGANKELRAQVEALSHQLESAKKEASAQTTVMGAAGMNGGASTRWVESILEDSALHREKMAAKLQQLRGEKEVLRKEAERMEDRVEELEGVVARLQRKGL
jgi:hypothetical protein